VTVADTSAAGELILPPINFTPGRDANFPAHPPIGPTLSQAYQSFQTQQAVFIDARAPALFAAGHIPGAWSLPAPRAEILPELSQKIPRNQLLIVYGQEGENVAQRSAQALRAAGYTQLRIMDQGFDSWRAAGFPVSETR